jgi:hypothetical protein
MSFTSYVTIRTFIGPTDADLKIKLGLLTMTIVGGGALGWMGFPLKRVRMDDLALFISNYFTEIMVPLRNVTDVAESGHHVTIRFRTQTRFGSKIIFMPQFQWFGFSRPHPVVDEIRSSVRRAGGSIDCEPIT